MTATCKEGGEGEVRYDRREGREKSDMIGGREGGGEGEVR